jgi:sulfite exporter TauE/SafE
LNIAGINYHPIIGLILLAALFLQPILGLIHHSQFKKLRRRQIWSHLHLWNGRIMIPLGMINGGLGLRIAGASKEIVTAYAAVAAVLCSLWIIVAAVSEARRRRARQQVAPQMSRRSRMAGRVGRREKKVVERPRVSREDTRSS